MATTLVKNIYLYILYHNYSPFFRIILLKETNFVVAADIKKKISNIGIQSK